MELRHLRYFVAVAEELHFGRAAKRLHIAQPPLSQQIKQLEAELGATLLTRTTRKVELTPAGMSYLENTRDILARVDRANDEVWRIADGRSGQLRIGFVGSATYKYLPQITRALTTELPDVDLDITSEMLTPAQVEALVEGTIDIGLLRPPVRNTDLEVEAVHTEPLLAVLSDGHPQASRESVVLGDLADDTFITYPSRHRSVVYDAAFDACRSAGFVPTRTVEVAETATMVAFVAAGVGVALVPESVRHLGVRGAAFRPLDDAVAQVDLALATRSGGQTPQIVRAVQVMRSVIGDI